MLLPADIISVQWKQTHTRADRSQTCSAVIKAPLLPAARHILRFRRIRRFVFTTIELCVAGFFFQVYFWSLSRGIRILSTASQPSFVCLFSKCVFNHHSTHTPATVEQQQQLRWRLKPALSYFEQLELLSQDAKPAFW